MNGAELKQAELDGSDRASSQFSAAYADCYADFGKSQLKYLQDSRSAYYRYVNALQEASGQIQERLAAAHKTFATATQEAQASSTAAFQRYTQGPQHAEGAAANEAHRDYMGVIQDAQRRSAEAYRAYVSALDEIGSTGIQSSDSAQQALAQALAALHSEVTTEQLEATRSYVRALKDAWAALDVDQAARALSPNPAPQPRL